MRRTECSLNYCISKFYELLLLEVLRVLQQFLEADLSHLCKKIPTKRRPMYIFVYFSYTSAQSNSLNGLM